MSCELLTLGNENASWTICPTTLGNDSIVYSFGVGDNVSFELELIRRFNVVVHAFDPTPRSIDWISSQCLSDKLVFHSYGVAARDGYCELMPPKNPKHVSYSMVRGNSVGAGIKAPVQRVSTITEMLGHKHIDVLKMDIEGAEYDVLQDVIASGIHIDQILVEFHHRWRELGTRRTREAIQQLNHVGYWIFNISAKGEEYSFKLTGEHWRSRLGF